MNADAALTVRVLIASDVGDADVGWIAAVLAEELEHQGVDVRAAGLPSIDAVVAFDAVILGVPADHGRWSASVSSMATVRFEDLRRRPVWLFGVTRGAAEHGGGAALRVEELARMTDAEGHRLFEPPRDRASSRGEVRAWATAIATALGCAPGVPASATASARASERTSGEPSHARGPRFWAVMLGVWPVAIGSSVIGWAVAGGSLAFWIASACAIAFGVDVLAPQVLVEIDDGREDDIELRDPG